MITEIGTEKNPLDVIVKTLSLEYKIKEAYKQAIDRVGNIDYKARLKEFLEEHEAHVEGLSNLLKKHNKGSLTKPSKIDPAIAKIKIMFADLMGDQAILSSIVDYELDSNKVYERIVARHDMWSDVKEILKQNLQEEKKHKTWLEDEIKYWKGN